MCASPSPGVKSSDSASKAPPVVRLQRFFEDGELGLLIDESHQLGERHGRTVRVFHDPFPVVQDPESAEHLEQLSDLVAFLEASKQ